VALTEKPGRYDVLISHVGMAEEDGYFLIPEVPTLAAEAGGEIPAVALTKNFLMVQAPDLSVESIQNRKSKILKPPHLSVGSI